MTIVPPPWTLTGDAYILLYRFTHAFAAKVTPPALEGLFTGGLGAVMLVDYHESPVGAYRELVFTPGTYALGRASRHVVTHIYVDSDASLESGRANWALPKQRAEFARQPVGAGEQWQVRYEGLTFFEAAFKPGRLAFPVWARLAPHTLVQPGIADGDADTVYETRVRGRGTARLADLTQPLVNTRYFPDVSSARPIGTLYLSRFRLSFLPPIVHAAHRPSSS